ncbi:MAG: prephenate dehydratase [Tannerellaceae bacterium]|jgi:prephenate dehydratase|nr:prephenate dehydratase [Tannerellaceae bacterium]
MEKRIAIQGIKGSFHDVAAHSYFEGEDLEIVGCDSFKGVVSEMKKDSGILGVMAIENTIAGSLLQNHELIRQSGFRIVGEYKLRISLSLSALPGVSVGEIEEVCSHPIALMQCSDFLGTMPGVRIVERDDTASSASRIAHEQLRSHAAICSRHAADLYGLETLFDGIETNKRNFTRFLVLADSWVADELLRGVVRNKASLVFTLPHAVGSLSQILSVLSFYDMNLTKIQSLPVIGREWQYLFYIDLTFGDYTRYKQALDAVVPLTKDFIILGEYAEGRQSV